MVITSRSGSGKVTRLNLADGLTKPTSGRVLLDGTDLWSIPDKDQSKLRGQKFGFIFQFPILMVTHTSQLTSYGTRSVNMALGALVS